MKLKFTRPLQYASLSLSVLIHLLLLMGFSMAFEYAPELKKERASYIPSYIDQSHSSSLVQETSAPQKQIITSKIGIEKKAKDTPAANPRPIRSLNRVMDVSSSKDEEPVHMVGEKGAVQPLLKLLGIAITHQLIYPKIAVDFNTKGTSVMGFVLYPDGHITDVKLLKSSSADVLDQEALSALNAISPLKNAGLYVTKPEYMVIGIIFG